MDPRRCYPDTPPRCAVQQFTENLVIPTELQRSVWLQSHTPIQGIALLLSYNPNASQTDFTVRLALFMGGGGFSGNTHHDLHSFMRRMRCMSRGEGGGDGVMASQTAQNPVAFSDPNYLFGMRGDVLYAKNTTRRNGNRICRILAP